MYEDKVLDVFLENQLQLLPERVADNRSEAAEFLEDCMAVVCGSIGEVRDYFDEIADVSDMSDEDLEHASEVFPIGDGRYLVVEG
ncbi:MAG: glyoxalase [Clostridiales bacterium]|nr:glyoxalase [Clostridiales bacterium]